MGVSRLQYYNRKCFKACAAAWAALPDKCPDPPTCGGMPSKESVFKYKQDRGVMSSYYDMWMRCCMGLCDDDGNLAGDLNSCFPCDSSFPAFGPDPDNPEVIADGGSASVGVVGGVPPYSWVLLSGACLSPPSAEGQYIAVVNNSAGCCSGEYLVTDACGSVCRVGLRGPSGHWVLQDSKDCVISGHATGEDELIHGIWRIKERAINIGYYAGTASSPEDCADSTGRAFGWCAGRCAADPRCDPSVGCHCAFACIFENRTLPCVDIYHCEQRGIHWWFGVGAFCLQYREVYKWEC